MTTRMAEPEWDEQTREIALALDAVDLCPICGRPSEVCQDPERQFDWEVGAPIRCHATTAVRERQKGVTEETNPHTDALMWPIRLRDRKEGGGAG